MQAYREIIKSKKLSEILELPGELRDEAELEIIILPVQKKAISKKRKKMSQSWAGALKKYKDQFTSLELQRKALEWR